MTLHAMSAITEQVQELYTRFPYPPAGVMKGTPIPAIMDYVRHIFWPGRSNLAGLRVLDAGCGTGMLAVSIARDHPEIEVVGIDLSDTSLQHARALAESCGVGKNLELRALAIEDVGALGQAFDYVVASGVLHHLESPGRGLRALTDVLTPTGGLCLMVYATYGRTGVYMLQNAIRVLGAGADYPELAAMARSLVTNLAVEHPFKSTRFADVSWASDAGIVDLLLHVRDRSFTVPQIFDLLDAAGLQPLRFMDRLAYNPALYIQDPALVQRFDILDERSRATVAELLNGRMNKHTLFATRTGYEPFQPDPAGLILLALRPRRSPLWDWSNVTVVGKKRHRQLHLKEFHVSDAYDRDIDLATWQMGIVDECDGIRTSQEIFDLPQVQAQIPGVDLDSKLQRFGEVLEILADQEIVLCN